MGYKRYPNNTKTNWTCPGCKVHCSKITSTPAQSIKADKKGECNLSLSDLEESEFDVLSFNQTSENLKPDISITVEKIADDIDKTSSLGKLTDKEYSIIASSTGWLDGVIIHESKLLLKKINPNIEGFQRPTLGPFRNFNVIDGEFVQILHTGGNHWICISSIGCQKGQVNLYDSLYHDIISDEVTEQTKSLLGEEFEKLIVVPVQQQQNEYDCGVFAIAYATCLVFMKDPATVAFDIPKMRPHLLECLRSGQMEIFSTVFHFNALN